MPVPVDVGRSGLTMLLNTDSKHSCSSLENSHLPDTLVTIFAGDTAVTLAALLLKDGRKSSAEAAASDRKRESRKSDRI